METTRRSARPALPFLIPFLLLFLLFPGGGAANAQRREHARARGRTRAAGRAAVWRTFSLSELLRILRAGGTRARRLAREVRLRYVDFRMMPDSEAKLRAAGADSRLVRAARESHIPPFSVEDVSIELSPDFRVPTALMVRYIRWRGVNFRMTPETEASLLKAGVHREVIEAARSNYHPVPRMMSGIKLDSPPTPTMIKPDPALARNDPRQLPYGIIDPKPAGPGSADAAGDVDYGRTFKPGEVTIKAVILSKPDPAFTEEARRNNVSGTVRLRLRLAASGEVTDITVVKGLPDGLSEQAVAAAKQLKFKPAQKDGRTVSQWATVEYYFNPY